MSKKEITIPDVNMRAVIEFLIDLCAAIIAGMLALQLAAGREAPFVGQLFALFIAIAVAVLVYKLMRAHQLLKPRGTEG